MGPCWTSTVESAVEASDQAWNMAVLGSVGRGAHRQGGHRSGIAVIEQRPLADAGAGRVWRLVALPWAAQMVESAASGCQTYDGLEVGVVPASDGAKADAIENHCYELEGRRPSHAFYGCGYAPTAC